MSAGLEPAGAQEDLPLAVRFRRRWHGTSRHLAAAATGPFAFFGGIASLSYLTGVDLPSTVWRILAVPVVVAAVLFGPRTLFVYGRELAAGHHFRRVRRWFRGEPR